MITEARVALVLSLAAGVTSVWQAIEAHRSNVFSEESVRVEVHSKFAENVYCYEAENPLKTTWHVVVYNTSRNSIQIKGIRTAPMAPPDAKNRDKYVWNETREDVVPVKLEPSSHHIFEVTALFAASNLEAMRSLSQCSREREQRERVEAEGNSKRQMQVYLLLGGEKRLLLPKIIDKGQFGVQVQVETTTGRLYNGMGHIYDVNISTEF